MKHLLLEPEQKLLARYGEEIQKAAAEAAQPGLMKMNAALEVMFATRFLDPSKYELDAEGKHLILAKAVDPEPTQPPRIPPPQPVQPDPPSRIPPRPQPVEPDPETQIPYQPDKDEVVLQ